MTLLAIVLVLVLELYFRISPSYRNFRWFLRFRQWLHRQFPAQFEGLGGVVFICGAVPLLLLILLSMPTGIGGQVGYLFISALVLWYCLGPEDLRSVLNPYFAAMERTDHHSAWEHIHEFVDAEAGEDAPTMARRVSSWVFSQINSRYIAVLFWFVLLGPAACLFYRLANIFADRVSREPGNESAEPSAQLLMFLNWIPARVTALVFALVGDFMRGYSVLHPYWRDGAANIEKMLLKTGLGALALTEELPSDPLDENVQAMALAERALILVVVLIALLSMFGALI